MSPTTTLEYGIANSSVIATESLNSLANGRAFSPGSIELLVLAHSRRKRVVRSQDSILTAILEACRSPSVQHWIMVKARLGYITFWHHMNSLISQGMMETVHERNKTLYRINAKGIDYLEQLEAA